MYCNEWLDRVARIGLSMVACRLTGIALLAAALLPFSGIAADAANKSPLDHAGLLQALVSGKTAQVRAAVKSLGDSGDRTYYDLLTGLYAGKLYVYEPRAGIDEGLVLAGVEVNTDKGDTLLPLFSIRPKAPLTGKDGKPLLVDVFDLTEVDSDRGIREDILSYRTLIDLISGTEAERLTAVERIGESGDAAMIGALKTARTKARGTALLRGMDIAVNRLRLTDPDALTRYQAVDDLDELHATQLIPYLESRVAAADGAAAPETDPRVAQRITEAIDSLYSWQRSMSVVQTIFSGISLGSILVLIGLGLSIIYGLMGVINMAHGEFMMIGAYTTFCVQSLFLKFAPPGLFDLFFVLSLPAGFLVAGFAGLVVEALVIRHLYSRPLESLLATWGISLILIQAARRIFGDLTAVQMPSFLSGGFAIFPQVVLPYGRLFIMALTVFVVLGLFLVFYRTRFGMRIRAVTQNRNMSACLGIPTRRIDSLAFFMGSGLAGLAGCAVTLVGNVVPNMGQSYIVDSFLVVVVGGVGKMIGCVVSGMGIGFATKLLEPVFQAVYGKVIILAMVIIFLQHKPTGLFPAKGRSHD